MPLQLKLKQMKRAPQNLPHKKLTNSEFHELPLKINNFKQMKQIGFTLVIAAMTSILVSCTKSQAESPTSIGPTPFPVQTATRLSEVTIFNEYAANLEGVQNIEIRPKVDGFIDKIYVDEGSEVKRGQMLFKLRAETLDQQAEAAKANVEVAKAQVKMAQVEVNKVKPLVQKNIISSIQLETAESNLTAAKAQLEAATASYLTAKENLGYTLITSPVDGIVGSIPYRIGSLVGRMEPQPLTSVSNISKVRAYFTLNEKQLLAFNRQLNGNSVNDKIKELPEVELILADGSTYEHKGRIETINGMVNPRTGGISYRACFPNPENLLRSGTSGKVKMSSTSNNVFVVPQKSTFELQGQKFVYLVDANNKVNPKMINVVNEKNNNYIVSRGLNEGEHFISDGIIKVRAGMEIKPKKVNNNTK